MIHLLSLISLVIQLFKMFPQTNNLTPLRTDTEFRVQINERDHNEISVFEISPNFDMLDGLVSDYMHLICLGTMRKLLHSNHQKTFKI